MGRKVWTAEEIERLSPAEQDELFKSSLVADLDDVPAEFLERVRARFEERGGMADAPRAPK